jgi:hypothetical protein
VERNKHYVGEIGILDSIEHSGVVIIISDEKVILISDENESLAIQDP